MRTWKHHPEELGHYIDAYWFLHVEESDSTPYAPRLLPTASAHYIITPHSHSYHYQYSDTIRTGCGSHLLGPSTESITLNDSAPSLRLGIKFKPGALYALFGIEGGAVLNTSIPLPDLEEALPYSALEDALAGTDKHESIIKLFNRFFLRRAELARHDGHYELMTKAAQLMDHYIEVQDWMELGTQNLATKLNCSKRTLERAFGRITGVTIKQYQTMQKLDALFVFLNQESNMDWASVAERFNFSDQAHLIRQLRTTLGKTPMEYSGAKDLVIDLYGNFE